MNTQETQPGPPVLLTSETFRQITDLLGIEPDRIISIKMTVTHMDVTRRATNEDGMPYYTAEDGVVVAPTITTRHPVQRANRAKLALTPVVVSSETF